MHTNPLLEEIWETRRRLLEEAGGDLATLAEQTRRWAETQDLPNRVKHEDLREFFKRQKEKAVASGGAPAPRSWDDDLPSCS